MQLLLLLAGCGHAEDRVLATATELCRWGQMDGLAPALLPAELDLSELVRGADLRFVRDQDASEREEDPGNPFQGAGELYATVVADAGQAFLEGYARVAQCEVQAVVEGDRATARVKRTIPKPAETLGLDEVYALQTHEERLAKVQGWLDAAVEVQVTETELRLVRDGARWLADYGLPEKALAEAEAKLVKEREAVARSEAAAPDFEKFEILSARFTTREEDGLAARPFIDLTVKNGGQTPIVTAYFQGTLQNADRTVTWIDEGFSYTVPDGLQPGEQVQWTLKPGQRSRWYAVAPEGAVFSATLTRLDGPDGTLLYSAAAHDKALAKVAALEAEIAKLRPYLGG